MELRDYIQEGEVIAGSAKELSKLLGLAHATYLSNAKSRQRGLPLAACYKLADLIKAPRDSVAAASALVTEKDEEVRAYLIPFVQVARHVQHLMIAGIVTTTALTLALENTSSTIRAFLL